MNVQIRIPKDLFTNMRNDLMRPHAHTGERVGFLYGKLVSPVQPLILLHDYQPVADNNYIDDYTVGARINSIAIREAMQRALNDSIGVFHVHLHGFSGRLSFSRTDKINLARLVPSFQAVAPMLAHGALVLNEDNCAAMVWLPGTKIPITSEKISIIGWPMGFFGGDSND